MTLFREIEGCPGLYKDTNTGRIFNMRDFRPFEVTADLKLWRSDEFRLDKGELWFLDHWSVVIHPWPEVISPLITISLAVCNDFKIQEMPLFRIAEPLRINIDNDLEKRLSRIERHLGIDEDVKMPGSKMEMFLSEQESVYAQVYDGPGLSTLANSECFRICFRGKRRAPVR